LALAEQRDINQTRRSAAIFLPGGIYELQIRVDADGSRPVTLGER
jgi:hypothetical protein